MKESYFWQDLRFILFVMHSARKQERRISPALPRLVNHAQFQKHKLIPRESRGRAANGGCGGGSGWQRSGGMAANSGTGSSGRNKRENL